MKTLSLLAALTLAAALPAQAQTIINGVTITKPVQTAPPAPSRRTVPAFVDAAVPTDWVDIRGRVSAGGQGRTDLPAGSQVTVKLLDTSRMDAAAKTLVSTTFPSRSLPVSYQLVSSPRRFTTSGTYTVAVRVSDASGKLIYTSDTQHRINPAAKRVLADIPVVAVKQP